MKKGTVITTGVGVGVVGVLLSLVSYFTFDIASKEKDKTIDAKNQEISELEKKLSDDKTKLVKMTQERDQAKEKYNLMNNYFVLKKEQLGLQYRAKELRAELKKYDMAKIERDYEKSLGDQLGVRKLLKKDCPPAVRAEYEEMNRWVTKKIKNLKSQMDTYAEMDKEDLKIYDRLQDLYKELASAEKKLNK